MSNNDIKPYEEVLGWISVSILVVAFIVVLLCGATALYDALNIGNCIDNLSDMSLLSSGEYSRIEDCYGVGTSKIGNEVVGGDWVAYAYKGNHNQILLSNLVDGNKYSLYRKNYWFFFKTYVIVGCKDIATIQGKEMQ